MAPPSLNVLNQQMHHEVVGTLGLPRGAPIVLAPVNDGLGLAITEGIEDGLSVYAATGLGVWAAGSAPLMPALADAVPNYVQCVTI